jgi:hypothetical protein
MSLDKLGHLAAFALAAFLWHRSGTGTWGTLLVCGALAVGTEVAQGLWVPARSAEWADLVADFFGTLLGVLLATHLVGALHRAVARVVYGGRARRALAAAHADLAALPLPEAIARRERWPLAPRRRPLALRVLVSAIAQEQRRASERAPCLPRTLALVGEARRLGYAPRLVVGVREPDEQFGPRAWLELEGKPFLEDERAPQRFEMLTGMEAAEARSSQSS